MPKPLAPDGSRNLIGKRVRSLRREHQLSQEQLMARLQVLGFDSERGVIKRIESGSRYVSDIELYLFAQFFQVSYDYLLDEPDSKEWPPSARS